MPGELIIKAETLGASTWQIILRVILPQIVPRLADSLRLSLGPAWLFLISAEAIAATDGLGYRIFLMRRYLAMDVILPYVAWITLLAFAMDWLLRLFNRRCFPWLAAGRVMSHVIGPRTCLMEYPGQVVLERVNLEIPSGSFNVLIGPSGCGKSTFLRLLLSMEQPTRGSILLDGEALPPEPGPDRGIVFQRYSVFPHLTVVQNVILGLEFARSREVAAEAVLARRGGRRSKRQSGASNRLV